MGLVPGGGLLAHEAAGGHTIARHVGLTDAQLAARLLADSYLPAASTFRHLADAEVAIGEALDAHAASVSIWAGGTGNKPLVLTHALPNTAQGKILVRGATNATSASAVRVILKRDSSMACHYRIQTAYPE